MPHGTVPRPRRGAEPLASFIARSADAQRCQARQAATKLRRARRVPRHREVNKGRASGHQPERPTTCVLCKSEPAPWPSPLRSPCPRFLKEARQDRPTRRPRPQTPPFAATPIADSTGAGSASWAWPVWPACAGSPMHVTATPCAPRRHASPACAGHGCRLALMQTCRGCRARRHPLRPPAVSADGDGSRSEG